MPTLLYLHGFLSSPQSQKAQQAESFYRQLRPGDELLLPSLSAGPAEVVNELRSFVDEHGAGKLILMGSSLGGFYATILSDEYDIPAVLINPAVRPYEFWESHVGEHKNYYTDQIHVVTGAHIHELAALEKAVLKTPENFRVYLQTGDEVLDYQQAVDKYSQRNCVVRENGNHSYENFTAELPSMFDFLLSRNRISAR